MKGKSTFTTDEVDKIRALIDKKVNAQTNEQKRIEIKLEI